MSRHYTVVDVLIAQRRLKDLRDTVTAGRLVIHPAEGARLAAIRRYGDTPEQGGGRLERATRQAYERRTT